MRKIRIIFQAGEEVLKGARLMLEQGILDNPRVSAILGLHLVPQFPLMSVSLTPKVRDLIFSRITSVMKGLEQSFGIEAEFSFISGSPPVICDEDLTKTGHSSQHGPYC